MLADTIGIGIGVFFAVMIVLGFIFGWNKKEEDSGKSPYEATKLLTEAEYDFFRALEKATEDKYYIFVQPRLPSLIRIKDDKFSWHLFSPIGSKSVDFVLADKKNLNTLLAIELDDRSHEKADRQRRDQFVDKILADAGVKLIRIKNKRQFNVWELRGVINRALG